jgi:LacI family transcriptional regulator
MPATIRDVAKKAGVGLGTVSRVINQSPKVSVETRKRVLDAIEELDFRPSPIARRLSLGRTQTIATLVPFFTRPATVERLRGVEISIAGSEYDLIVFNIETPERRDSAYRDIARRERVDGLLVISLPPTPEALGYLKSAKIPLVFVDVNHPDIDAFPRVVVDDVQGSRLAIEHLLELGHKRIGFISDPLNEPFSFTASHHRFQGYQQALDEAGIQLDSQLHRHTEHGRYEARELALELLGLPERPTAIFAASDTQAIGVLEAARSIGLKVPEQLSVVGYDDLDLAAHLNLTTVRQLLFESGQIGVRMLLEAIADPELPPTCEWLPTELVVRGTTASLH